MNLGGRCGGGTTDNFSQERSLSASGVASDCRQSPQWDTSRMLSVGDFGHPATGRICRPDYLGACSG